ncbi:MAG: hypothetical protein JXR89_10480 [Deltaproteobacteria bacterium]|nr:hypothetical protein [Deltaproteobacteria bacterium]
MNASEFLQNAAHPQRYNYFFEQKHIEAPHLSVLCRSVARQLQSERLLGDLAAEIFDQEKDCLSDCLFSQMEFTFLFRPSPIDEIEGLVSIYFALVFWGDGYGECYHGLSIWSDLTKDFYTFLVAGSAPAAIRVLDYNFSSCLSRIFLQAQEGLEPATD